MTNYKKIQEKLRLWSDRQRLNESKRKWKLLRFGEVVRCVQLRSIEITKCRLCSVEYEYTIKYEVDWKKKSNTLNDVKYQAHFDKARDLGENLCSKCYHKWIEAWTALRIPEERKKSIEWKGWDDPIPPWGLNTHKRREMLKNKYRSIIDVAVLKSNIRNYDKEKQRNRDGY